MFQKRSRESRDQQPGGDRLRVHLEDLFLSNTDSSAEIREMFEDAAALGVHGAKKFAKAGGFGTNKKNVKRDLLRQSMKKTKDWPDLYYIDVHCLDLDSQSVQTRKLPILLPHEIIFAMKEKGNTDAIMFSQECMPQCTRDHMKRVSENLGIDSAIGIGLWGDGVPTKFDRSESLECLTMNLPGPATAKNMRIPITCLNKKFVVKNHTWEAVCSVLAWSFQVLASGVMPACDHVGRPLTGKRAKWAGKPVTKSLLIQFRGDWAWYKYMFRFPQHNELAGCCWLCSCTPGKIRQVGANAGWRGQTLSHLQLLQRMIGLQQKPCSLFGAPGFVNTCCLIDWLHSADQGVLLHYLAQTFKYILLKYLPGNNKTEKCRNLWLKMRAYYATNHVDSKLDMLTLSMLGSDSKPPVLRARAAEARFLVPFSIALNAEYLDLGDKAEQAMHQCGLELQGCYQNLSPEIFCKTNLRDHSRRFCLLYCALEKSFADKCVWHVTPKLHLFQHLCEDMESCPSLFWTYRDEEMGGSVMKIGLRRGGRHSITAAATDVLSRFMAKNRIPVLAA